MGEPHGSAVGWRMPEGAAPPTRRRAGHALIRHALVPALLALSVGPILVHQQAAGWLAARSLRLDPVGAAIALAIFAIWSAEQLWPGHPEWTYRPLSGGPRAWSGFGRDLVYLLGVTQLSALLIGELQARLEPAMAAARARLGVPLTLWPAAAPLALRVLLAFLLVELCSYWMHRAAHRFRPLWQFHSTHHVVGELGALKSFRTHPVDNALFYLARMAPLLLLGAGAPELITATWLGGLFGVLSHANLDLDERGVGLLLNLPRVHAFHHSVDAVEQRSNFGCHTVLWDRVFGTYRAPAVRTGAIGVHPVGPRSLWQELAWPLYRRVGE